MPDVTYAVVPTTPQSPAKAAAIKDLLTNLVDFSHNGGSLALPSGYAPLSDALYQAAITDIGKDVVAQPSPTTTTTTPAKSSTTATPTTTSTGSDTGSSAGGYGGTSGDDDSGSGQGSLPLSTPSGSGGAAASQRGSSGGVGVAATAAPTGFLLVGLDQVSRYLLPAIVLLALACLIAGPLLLLAPAIRRRRRGAGGSS
jgi:hypothetical protein